MLFITILVLSVLLTMLCPWWWGFILLACCAGFFLGQNKMHAFCSGAFAISLIWLTVFLYKSIVNKFGLLSRVAAMFHIPNGFLLLLLCVLVGGFLGGLSSLSGQQLKNAFKRAS